jgi:membrane-bound metal-dependent hydrolase YbcI (DUF457 family)
MGRGHQAVGAASFLVFGSAAAALAGQSLSPTELGCGALVASGASLAPDLDCPQATIARSLGPLTQGLSRVVAKLSGGHRHGTHSFLATVLVGIGLGTALYGSEGRYVALAVVFLCASLCLRLMTEAKGLVCASLAGIVALVITTLAPDPLWLLVAVVVGYLSHLAADFITVEGIPLFWPILRKQHSIAFIGHTESFREKLVARGCGLLSVYLLVVTVLPMWQAA